MFIAALVLVFRTDVRTRRQAAQVCKSLQASGMVQRATVDLADCDRVLRVVTNTATDRDIVRLTGDFGIHIEALL